MNNNPLYIAPAALITNNKGHYLMLQRSLNSKVNPGRWDMSGGKPEPGETLDQALIREVREETGLIITDIGALLGTAELLLNDKRIIYLIFRCGVDGESVTLSSEHEAFSWVDKDEIKGLDLAPQFITFFDSSMVKL